MEDVDRDEAEAQGVIKPTDKVRPIKKDFLDGLEESVRGLDDQTRRWIQAQMENRVRFLGDTAVYQPDNPRRQMGGKRRARLHRQNLLSSL